MPDYAKLCSAAVEAVTLASAVCREVQRSLEQVRSITKDDRSPVTVADFAAQAIVAKSLSDALHTNFVLVGEENSKFLRQDDHTPHLQATLAAVQTVWPDATEDDLLAAIDLGAGDTQHAGFWTLDPVDGTKGFLRNQQYAIALAYIERGTPAVGAMACPNLPRHFSKPLDLPDPHGCIYAAIKGDGLYEYPADDRAEKPNHIQRLDHEQGQPISICASVEAAHSNADDTDRILQHLAQHGHPTGEPTRLDSQAKYAVTARGQADAYLRLPTRKAYVERIWDHAAGSLVATEAGCFVTDIRGNALDFSHGRGLEKNKGVVCAPPRVHGLLMGAIEALGIAEPA